MRSLPVESTRHIFTCFLPLVVPADEIYLSVTTRAVIGQFRKPYFTTVRPAKFYK